uniref:Uncharacterized protein n=1 Tax=Myoviridae sp. ct1Js5 TaxID=2826601 RepID=A0A8S5M9Q5_9CAUD|nr:MAG TPA: hypothetical protein [Myoviridae sp. ct1Js5]
MFFITFVPLKKCTFRFNFWYISFCGLYKKMKGEKIKQIN